MSRSRSHLVMLGFVTLVMGATFLVGYYNAIRLGLDLQGGLEIVLQAKPPKGRKVTQEDLTKSVTIIRERVDALGVAEPEIRTQGQDQIAIELPGIKNPDEAVKVVGSTAQLFFYDLEERISSSKAYRTPWNLLTKNQERAEKELAKAQKKYKKDDTLFDEQYYLFDDAQKMKAGPAPSVKDLVRDLPGKKLPKGWKTMLVPPGERMIRGNPDYLPMTVDEAGKLNRKEGVWLLIEHKPALAGNQIRQATPQTDQGGGWATGIQFTRKGGKKFGDVTADIARAGALAGRNKQFAIVLDDEIKSAPSIDYRQFPNGIRGSGAQITGLDDRKEAESLALVLNTGALPVRFEILSKTQVSATLGKESLRQGLWAGAAGLALVMIYLILFYRLLGLVADLSLAVFAFAFYGVIVGMPITMTLPGIAGMVLTIGVAADANIIIFERIREEYRAGRTVQAAIRDGFSKGIHTIIDANVVTIITALVLFVLATGSVRGFALLLGIGTALSMMTVVALTWALLGLMAGLRLMNSSAAIGGSRKERRISVPWSSYRRGCIIFTACAVVAMAGTLGVKRLNLGIDFKGGTKIDVRLDKKTTPEQIRSALVAVNPAYRTASIQAISESKNPTGASASEVKKRGSGYAIRLEKLLPAKNASAKADASSTSSGQRKTAPNKAERSQRATNAIRDELDQRYGVPKNGFSSQEIGASFGREVLMGAIFAIIFSLILEVAYISARFEFKFSIPVLAALLHDLLIAVGAYAATGREFSSATVAALLTILGYSLYDTIIVFDRVRENVHDLRKATFARIVEVSLNEVIVRSLNTTLVVLMPILALFFFGGATLKDFAFALLVGIIVGAYSSIVVAAPLLSWVKEREPEWQRRITGTGSKRRAKSTTDDSNTSSTSSAGV